MSDKGKTIRRRRLSRGLRHWRAQAGLTADEAAEALLCGAGTISRMENGLSADPFRIKGAFELYGAPQDVVTEMIKLAKESRTKRTTIRKPYHDFVPKRLAEYYELEDEASALAMLEGEFVPGLLETPEYARALIAAGERQDEVDRLLEIRLDRQRRLAGPGALQVRVILGEAALHTQVGGPRVLHAQLKHLEELARDADNVTIRILPFTAGSRPALGRNFTILSFPDPADLDVIFAESVSYFVLEDEIDEVGKFQSNYTRLRQAALDEDDSAKLIRRVASEMT